MKRSFVKEHFERENREELLGTITPNWTDENLNRHIGLLNIPNAIHSIAEIGCGMARILLKLSEKIEHCVGFDASSRMIEEGKKMIGDKNIQLIKVDGEGILDIGISDYFDFVFSIITFQHIPNTETVKKYISEMKRIVKQGGKIRFQILTNDEQPGKELWTWHNPIDLINYMEDIGLTKIKKEDKGRWIFLEGIK